MRNARRLTDWLQQTGDYLPPATWRGAQVTTTQNGSGHFAYTELVRQDGDQNTANVNQHDGGGLLADVWQNGSHNLANLEQTGWNNNGFIVQTGGSNVATLYSIEADD